MAALAGRCGVLGRIVGRAGRAQCCAGFSSDSNIRWSADEETLAEIIDRHIDKTASRQDQGPVRPGDGQCARLAIS